MEFPELKKCRNMVFSCNRESYCRDMVRIDGTWLICPVREHTGGFDAYTAKGRNAIARALLKGQIDIDDGLIDIVYTCALCGNCVEHCEMYTPEAMARWSKLPLFAPLKITYEDHIVKTPEVTKALRADIFNAGYKVPEGIARVGESIERYGNIFNVSSSDMYNWKPKSLPEKAKLVYFPGCLAGYSFPEIGQSTVKILKSAGEEFTMFDHCCGNPLFITGQLKLARDVVERDVMKLEDVGAEKIVTTCAGCYRCISKEWPKIIGRDLDFEVASAAQLIQDYLKEGRIGPLSLEHEITVTYHDPCELGRHSSVYEEPRSIIKSIKGVKMVEMGRNMQSAWCCGGGGGLKICKPDLATEIARERVQEAEETGASAIVSACPSCKLNIQDAIGVTSSPLKMIDLVELIADAL